MQVLQCGLDHSPALVAVTRVQGADALVDESLLARGEAVDAADERADHGDHVVGLVLDGVGGRIVLQDDVHRVDTRAGAGADLDDLSAERGREGEVFAFRVDDDHLVVTVEEHAGDLLFDGEGFAAAGRAEHESVGVHVAAPVREDRVAAPGVRPVEQAVRLEHLLRGERDEDGRAVRGQGPLHGQGVVAQRQLGRQSLHLHELEALGRAGLRVDLGLHVPARDLQLLLACRGHAEHDDRVHEPLVGGAQLAKLFLLVGEVVGKVVGVEALLAVLAPLVHDLHLDLGVLAAHERHAFAAVHGRQVDAHVDAGAQAGQVVDQLVGQFRRQTGHPHGAVQVFRVQGFDVQLDGISRVDAPRAHEVLGVGLAGLMLEPAFVEPELLAGPEHLGHEAQPVLAVESGGLACVDGAHLADEVVAQRVEGRDGGLLVAFADGDGQGLDGAGVAADGFEFALGEAVVVEPVVVEAVAGLAHHHVGEDLAYAA